MYINRLVEIPSPHPAVSSPVPFEFAQPNLEAVGRIHKQKKTARFPERSLIRRTFIGCVASASRGQTGPRRYAVHNRVGNSKGHTVPVVARLVPV
jgi:hypothetical protein